MSRGPDTQTVEELRVTLQLYRASRLKLKEALAVAATIHKLEADVNAYGRDIIKLIESMDCKTDGNFGWEQRIVTMLSELTDVL